MFDNYGIKDVFYGIWRFKWLIAVVVILCTVAGYGYGVYNQKQTAEGKYCASVTYLVTTKEAGNQKDTKLFNDSKEFAQNLKSALSADFCYNYVINQMRQKYTDKEIAKIIHASDNKPTIAALSEMTTVNIIPDTSEVNLFVECSNEQEANDLLNAYKSYVKQENNIRQYCSVVELGGVTQQLDADAVTSPKSLAIIGFAGSLFVMILIVFIITLVRPTVNERGDIEQYEVPVIGNKKSADFTAAALLKAVPELKTIAVVSVDKQSDKQVDALAAQIKTALAAQGKEADTKTVANVTGSLEAVQTAADSDAVVICATRSYTKHSDFYNAVRLLNDNGVEKANVFAIL